MAQTYFYIPQKKTTTLASVGGITAADQTTGITVADVTGIDITKPGIICVNWSDPINTDLYEYISYTSIDGTNELQGVTRGAEDSTARASHSAGVTMAWVYSKSHINNINDVLNGVTEGIKVKTSIQDSNGNEVIKTPATASAVNELTVTNAATGNAVQLSATGGDTNIGLVIAPKGTGKVRIDQKVVTTTDDATAVINCDITDQYQLSAIANATEFTVTGTPTDGQKLIIRFKDAGVAKALTWTGFTAIGCTLPTTTVADKWHYVGVVYNLAATAWHALVASVQA